MIIIVNTVAVCVLIAGLAAFIFGGLMFSRTYSLTDGAALALWGAITMVSGTFGLGIALVVVGYLMCLVGLAAGEN